MKCKYFPTHCYKYSNKPINKTTQFDPHQFEYVDDRPFSQRFIDRVKEFGYLVKTFGKLVYKHHVRIFTFKSIDLSNATNTEKLDNEKTDRDLVIFIPGLDAPPVMWIDYVDTLEKKFSGKNNPEIRVIKNGRYNGNQPFEDTISPIVSMCEKYCRLNPNKKISVIGTSLGGKAALTLEHRLRQKGFSNKMQVVSISGAFGTNLITLGNKVVAAINKRWYLRWLQKMVDAYIHRSLRTDLSIKANDTFIDEINHNKTTHHENTQRLFISGMDETCVWPPSRCHPKVDERDIHYKIPRAGHISTTMKSLDLVCDNVELFMNESSS